MGDATTGDGRSSSTAGAERTRTAVAPRTDWESIERQARHYALRALGQEESLCPPEYEALLARTPIGKTLADLHPWKLDDDPLSGVALLSQAAGRYLIPFAEAVEHDLVACFAPERHQQPAVWLVNPWSAEKGNAVRAICRDFAAWLQYAEKIAREVRRREAELAARWSRTIGRP